MEILTGIPKGDREILTGIPNWDMESLTGIPNWDMESLTGIPNWDRETSAWDLGPQTGNPIQDLPPLPETWNPNSVSQQPWGAQRTPGSLGMSKAGLGQWDVPLSMGWDNIECPIPGSSDPNPSHPCGCKAAPPPNLPGQRLFTWEILTGIPKLGQGDPDWDPKLGYGDPDWDPKGRQGDPDWDPKLGYGEPDWDPKLGYGEPDWDPKLGQGDLCLGPGTPNWEPYSGPATPA
ncbi:hypothetical protein HGM15179_016565 [Zosterops borbonicus]|uniref:Uncharacterized protein n=1 Tax=Zosterops borbonicus TaxID=364589 RepID=A0A8K1G2V7_9PASS|nr:hypothetical protein HGM15179_016565 [Zosterops borbonicus]